jgi:hypothetical protein
MGNGLNTLGNKSIWLDGGTVDPHRVVGPYRCLRLIRGVPGVPWPDATRSNISIEWTRYKTRASHAGRYDLSC